MKLAACLVLLGFSLSSLTYVHTIKCTKCDPESMDACKEIPIDCSDDMELGHAFDSCFTYEMLAQRQDGTNFTHKIKNCSIRDGCQELRELMCDNANKTLNKLVKSCSIHCCDSYDYCNAAEPKFGELFTEPSTESPNIHYVQGYKSGSSTGHVKTSWILHLPLIVLVLFYIVD